MRRIGQRLREWIVEDIPFALATVVETQRSAPRDPGAMMAVSIEGEVVGDVSGGCVEGVVVEACLEALKSGTAQLVSFGFADAEAFAVGLSCGGEVDVFVEPVVDGILPALESALDDVDAGRPVVVATLVQGTTSRGAKLVIGIDGATGTLGSAGLDAAVVEDARGMLEQGTSGRRWYGRNGERLREDVGIFVASFAPPPRLLIFGAIDYTAAVVRVGKLLGFHVTVCDPRPLFATPRRFPEADEVVTEWPHRYLDRIAVDPRTVICVLTHDAKFDVPVLEVALATPAGYIGVMGSRGTHEDRLARLRAVGLSEDQLARLRSPIGLDIGSRTPEEVAVAIAGEIVRDRRGGTGLPLRLTEGAVHDPGRALSR